MVYKRSTTGVVERSYTYDEIGRPITRRTARNAGTVNDSFGYNTRSELTSATGIRAVEYNAENRPDRFTSPDGLTVMAMWNSCYPNEDTASVYAEAAYNDMKKDPSNPFI